MPKLIFFLLVFAISAGATAINYTPALKQSKLGLLAYVLLAAVSSAIWLLTARTLKHPKEVMALGLGADLTGKLAGLGLPFLFYGLEASPKMVCAILLLGVSTFLAN